MGSKTSTAGISPLVISVQTPPHQTGAQVFNAVKVVNRYRDCWLLHAEGIKP